jgi:hypothetical protein
MDNYEDGGDQNPPKGSIERPHKIPVTSKRKRKINKEGTNEFEPEDEISLEDMDLDANIEDIEFPDEEQRVQERRQVATELATQEAIIFEEEPITLHNDLFDKDSKKLVFEKTHSKNKKVQGNSSLELELNGVPPSKIV